MKNRKKACGFCIIDIDGTLFEEFKLVFNQIISEMFGKNRCIKVINRFFNIVNDLDFISNSMFMFKAVMVVYSIFSGQNYYNCLRIYEEKYCKLSKKYVEKAYNSYVVPIQEMGYSVLFITHDIYALKFNILGSRILVYTKKREDIPQELSKLDIDYIIGNNYMDDILAGKRLNVEYAAEGMDQAKIVYVGKSKLVKRLVSSDVKCLKNMQEVLDYIKDAT